LASHYRRALVFPAAIILLVACTAHLAAAQAPVSPAVTAEEARIYEAFRAWLTKQPAEVQQAPPSVVAERYRAELQRQGTPEQEINSTIATLRAIADRAEIERWNRILTAPKAPFNRAPNAFLVAMTQGLKPGRALDVGMGQGRNTIYLARQGWEAVGFDPAGRAVAAARQEAKTLGVTITTHVTRAEDFDWGEAQWDLIVLTYVGVREYVDHIVRALRPGGMVVVEAFHRDATKTASIGGGVVFDTNELLQAFPSLRVVRYEDTEAVGDFGLDVTRVVRLAAVKN
jgi:SAM-dependent methyltransferase